MHGARYPSVKKLLFPTLQLGALSIGPHDPCHNLVEELMIKMGGRSRSRALRLLDEAGK